jgi:hypothetical protein
MTYELSDESEYAYMYYKAAVKQDPTLSFVKDNDDFENKFNKLAIEHNDKQVSDYITSFKLQKEKDTTLKSKRDTDEQSILSAYVVSMSLICIVIVLFIVI